MPDGINRLIATQQAPNLLGAIQSGQQLQAGQLNLQQAQDAQARRNQLLQLQQGGAGPQQLAQAGFAPQAQQLAQVQRTTQQTEQEDQQQKIRDAVALTVGVTDPNEFAQKIQQSGRFDAEDTQFILQIGPQGLAQLAQQTGLSAGQREFAELTADLTEEQQKEAKLIKLGLSPRAVGSAIQTISDKGITEQIADAEATITQRKKFAEMTGASRAKTIDQGFDKIVKINQNLSNIDRAIEVLQSGAGTGAIERFLPSFKAASVELDNLRNQFALDVIGSVTLGAISEAELDLVKQTGLPEGLNEPELIDYLQRRKAAQEKLRGYFQEQIDFLDQGGSVAGFLRMKQRGQDAQTQPATDQPQAVLPQGVTEEDIAETMRANNMTREQVLQRLQSGG